MQLRCTYCQTMFAISHEEMLAGLEHMEEEKLKYYDAHCPKCRRANRVERLKMEMAYPNWKADLKTMAKEATAPAAPAASPARQKAPAVPSQKEKPVMKATTYKTPATSTKKPAVKKTPSPNTSKSQTAVKKAPSSNVSKVKPAVKKTPSPNTSKVKPAVKKTPSPNTKK